MFRITIEDTSSFFSFFPCFGLFFEVKLFFLLQVLFLMMRVFFFILEALFDELI